MIERAHPAAGPLPAIEIRIARDSVNDEVVDIVAMIKGDGDVVNVGDDLLEYETSKGTVVVSAEIGGVFRTRWSVGDEVAIGEALGVIEPIASGTSGG